MDVSIVVPLLNEEESLSELCDSIVTVVNANNLSYEIILVDDGSTDNSWCIIEKLVAANQHIKGIKFQRNYGKSAALNEGFRAAKGEVVITMDADLQDSPEEIPALVRMIVEGGYDLVSGWKKKRFDPLSKTIPTKIYNIITGKIHGLKLHDLNCGLKAYKKNVIKSIEVYGEMHRYIPVIAKWSGFKKIGEKVVEHRPRKYGKTKFGWERFINGFLDLATITFVSKFQKRPMHFFGLYGTLCFATGFFMIIYLLVLKISAIEFTLTNRPAFYMALAIMIIGMQLFLAGFIAELISRNATDRNNYLIEKKAGIV